MPGPNQTYVLTFTDNAKSSIVVQPLVSESTSTSLSFVGKGFIDYGETVQDNLLHMLEHFAKSTSPAHPIEGQVWYDTSGSKNLKVYNGSSWVLVNDPTGSVNEIPMLKVDALSNTNTTLSGLQTIDGVVLVDSNRVLLINQTAPAENGIWLAHIGSWTRPDDYSTWNQVVGTEIYITRGTNHAYDLYQNINVTGGVLNTTAITFSKFSSATSVYFGTNAGRSVNDPTTTNVALGSNTLTANVSGSRNIAICSNALQNNTASENIGIGRNALNLNTAGTRNVGVGTFVIAANLTGNDNTAFGHNALLVYTGSSVVAIGSGALKSNISSANNTAIGTNALTLTTGDQNIGIGNSALAANTSGTANVGVGYLALSSTSTGTDNTAVGNRALRDNTGNFNAAFGSDALATNISGTDNIAIGYHTLDANTNGTDNIAIGSNTLGTIISGTKNIGIGTSALAVATGSENIAIGYHTLVLTTSGIQNTIVGTSAMAANLGGSSNVAIGYKALESNASGSRTIAIGYQALDLATAVSDAIAIGYQANSTSSAGSNSIAIGQNVDALATRSVATGDSASSSTIGKWAHAVGKFSVNGDAQTGMYVLRGSTNSATPAVLTTDGAGAGSTNQVTVTNDSTMHFMVHVVARRTDVDNESAAYRYEGCVDNNSSVTALVGSVSETIVAEDDAPWAVVVTANDTTDSLNITVTGEVGKTIRWVAFVRTTEVTG